MVNIFPNYFLFKLIFIFLPTNLRLSNFNHRLTLILILNLKTKRWRRFLPSTLLCWYPAWLAYTVLANSLKSWHVLFSFTAYTTSRIAYFVVLYYIIPCKTSLVWRLSEEISKFIQLVHYSFLSKSCVSHYWGFI